MQENVYHGTSVGRAKKIKQAGRYYHSDGSKEWLGEGAYFFIDRNAFENACKWIKYKVQKDITYSQGAVLINEMNVEEENLVDLNNPEWQEVFQEYTKMYIEKHEKEGFSISAEALELDCSVLNDMCKELGSKAVKQQRYIKAISDTGARSHIPNCTIISVRDDSILKICSYERV